MIRYEEKMSEIYGLGSPCSGRSTRTLRLFLRYDVAVPLEVPKSLGGGWPSHKPFDKRASRKPTGFSPWVRRAIFSCMGNSSLLSMHLCG